MFGVKHVTDDNGTILIQDPPFARFLFQSTAAAWLWLVVRLYECANRRGPFELKFPFPVSSASEVNLLEEEQAAAEIGSDGQTIQGFLKPFEIKTFLVNF